MEYDKNKKYSIQDAIKIIKEVSPKRNFDESVEVHIVLGIDPKKGDQQVRGTVSLPHGTGKDVKVAVFAEGEDAKKASDAGADVVGGQELIDEIKHKGAIDFDVAVAHPSMMPKIAQIAKILGPKGLMPSPKDGTVVENVAKAVEEVKKGKISFKNDDTGNLHSLIGKRSFDDQKLVENFEAFIDAVRKSKPSSSKGIFLRRVYISTTMGPSVEVEVG